MSDERRERLKRLMDLRAKELSHRVADLDSARSTETSAEQELQQAQTRWPNGPDAGMNRDYATYLAMENDTGPNGATGVDIRFRHINNTQGNALFADGHAEGFRWKRPGFGGSDLQFKNFILDNYRTQEMVFIKR